jgi:hypothetical protein
MNCRVCDGTLIFKWALKVLNNKYDAHYYECMNCGVLQIPNPYWLEESYKEENLPREFTLDSERFRRNFSAYSYLVALLQAGCFPSNPSILDYGGGYGLLTQMFVDSGCDAWTSDSHVISPFLASDRYIGDIKSLADHSFDIIVSLEVFEHLVNPLEIGTILIKKLKKNGTLVISTSLYKPGIHAQSWVYLAREGGQHITFWTKQAISHFANLFSFNSVGYFPSVEGFLILISSLPEHELYPKLKDALTILRNDNFRGSITKNWDFLNINILSESVAAVSLNESRKT